MKKSTSHILGPIFTVLCCFKLPIQLSAQILKVDTAHVYTIPEVVVTESHHQQELKASVPVQILTSKELKNAHALQLSDAVKHFAGVTVKDYGGIGGLKTVSLRGMGAEHTAIGYDGITITDCQTGQIDIGRFSLEHIDRLSLSNGQNDQIFQPARYYASAGVLNIQSKTPLFNEHKDANLDVTLKGGSWWLINPSLWYEQKLTSKWAMTIGAEWMSSKGNYPYILHYGNESDLTSKEHRENTQVKNLRFECSIHGKPSTNNLWKLKAYYYQSDRGLPNATTLYNSFSDQHLTDKNAFIQGNYRHIFNEKWQLQSSAKWNWSYQHYLDPSYNNTAGELNNTYIQQEYYLTASALYKCLPGLTFNYSMDGSIQTLDANLYNFAYPTRFSWLNVLAGKYSNRWMDISASVLYTFIHEDTRKGACAGNHNRWSPYASISFKPFRAEDFKIRFFYKEIFRLPNFNDLYYSSIGDSNLRPEKTRQFNIGLAYQKQDLLPFISSLYISADGFFNNVSDKIIAIPTKDIFIWSMTNLGKVDIKGLDFRGDITFRLAKNYNLKISSNHTYQRALDVTNELEEPFKRTYKHQIAYVPRISGSGQASLETPWINLRYAIVYSGKRYSQGENIAANALNGYQDHSISVDHDFEIGPVTAGVNVEILNICNKNYEIIRNFPMPGRSCRISVKIEY